MPDVTEASEWTGRVGSAWAEEWRRTDRSFGSLTARLVDPAAIGAFALALDIGCGAGEAALRLAGLAPQAKVLGIDISTELLAVARTRARNVPNLGFAEADAGNWRAAPGSQPDLLVSRHGVMFFADPVAAFAHLADQATPSARLRFTCFRARAENDWAQALASILPPQPPVDPREPGPFAFAEPSRVEPILSAAGWRAIDFEPLDYAMIAGEGTGALEEAVAYFQRIGPAARALAEMLPAERAAARERLRDLLATYHSAGAVSLPAAAWLVTARL